MMPRRPLALLAGSLVLSGASATPPVSDVSPPESAPLKAPALSPAEEARRDALTRYGVGLIRARHDQIATAAKQFEVAAKQQPSAVAPQKELAKLYAELGREPAAAAAGEKVLAADPHDLDTARLLGRLYADARRYPDAVRVFKLAAASKELTDPVSKLVVLKDLARAADAALDPAAATARADALALLKEQRVKFLHPDVFTVAELERERVRLYEGLGTAHLRKGEYPAAVAAFDAARDLAADPKAANDSAGVARLHWNLSGVRLAEGEPAKALAEVEKFLSHRPAAFEPYERFVLLKKQLKKADDLPRRLAELAEVNPKNLAPQWLAAAEAMAKQQTSAHELFRRLAEKGTTPDEYRVLAAAYRDADKPKDLLDLLDKLYKAVRPDGGEEPNPDAKINPDALARSRLLTQAVRQLKPGFSDRLVTEATANLPGTVRHTDTLELLYGLGRRDGVMGKTTDLLHASAKKRPKDYRLKALTVGAFAELRQWRTITDIAHELSEFENGMRYYPSIRAEAAVAHAELGEKKQALELLKGLGETPYTQTQRARVLNVLGDHAAALKACDEGLTNDKLTASEQRSLLTARATALNLLKKYAEAEAIWRELLDADPDNVLALNNLGYELADQNRKLDEAEKLLRRAIELDKWERGRGATPTPRTAATSTASAGCCSGRAS